MILTTAVSRPLRLVTRALQWSSAVIVVGLTSYFIKQGPKGQHIIYQEVIAVLSIAFFFPAFVAPFLPTALSKFILLIDVVFSYLWLTAYIFAAQDYNEHSCYLNAPPGITCTRKKANESFIFLAFIFTFFGMCLEVASFWAYRKTDTAAVLAHGKNEPGAHSTWDAQAEQNVPAETV